MQYFKSTFVYLDTTVCQESHKETKILLARVLEIWSLNAIGFSSICKHNECTSHSMGILCFIDSRA